MACLEEKKKKKLSFIQEKVSLPNFLEEKNLTAVDASMSKYSGKLFLKATKFFPEIFLELQKTVFFLSGQALTPPPS